MPATAGQQVNVTGRLVWGQNLFAGTPKVDDRTKQPVIDSVTGKQVIEWSFGLAVKKADLTPGASQAAIVTAIGAEAAQLYPQGNFPPKFAWKYKDGDGVDHEGNPFANRKGHAGCYIFALTTRIKPKFFTYNNGAYTQVEEGIEIGYHALVQVTVKAHTAENGGQPGMYLNPNMVCLAGYDEIIVSERANPEAVFGNAAPVVPQGASAMPLVQAPQMGQGQSMGMPGMGQQAYQQPVQQQAPQPHVAVLPNHMQQQYQQQVPNPGVHAGANQAGYPNVQPGPGPMGAVAPGYEQMGNGYAGAGSPGMPGLQPTQGYQQPNGQMPQTQGQSGMNYDPNGGQQFAQGATQAMMPSGAPSQNYQQPTGQPINQGGTAQTAYPSNGFPMPGQR